MPDRAEQLLQAVDILFQKRFESINFDTTIKCTIVDAKDSSKGKYIVSNGSSKFSAYSNILDYKKDDKVLVTIPNGDYNQQKIIIGKQVNTDTDVPYNYKNPLSTIIPILTFSTNNSSEQLDMYANNYENEREILSRDFSASPLIGYDRLGLSGDFSTWLQPFNCVAGSYGLHCAISFKTEGQNSSEPEIDTQHFFLDSETDFYGNVYNFDSFYTQEAVFDISDYADKKIIGIKLYIYQRQNFISQDGSYVPAPDYDLTSFTQHLLNKDVENLNSYYSSSYYNSEHPEEEDFSSNIPNIFFKEPQIIFGYPVDTFADDEIFIFSTSDSAYRKNQSDEENRKFIELRWIHDMDTGGIRNVTSEDFNSKELKNYKINWYRRSIGAPTPDAYAGEMYWKKVASFSNSTTNGIILDEDDSGHIIISNAFLLSLIPDTTLAIEQIKAILVKGTTKISQSQVITFTNDEDVQNKLQTDLENALGIACGVPTGEELAADAFEKDAYQGSFFIYKKGNELIDESKSKELFTLTPTFKSPLDKEQNSYITPLEEAKIVVWSFPVNNTMLVPVYGPDNIVATKPNVYLTNENNILANFIQYLPDGSTGIRHLISYGNRSVNSDTFPWYAVYNETAQTFEFIYFGSMLEANENTNPWLDRSLHNTALQHYFIKSTYNPAFVNNTVSLQVIKERIRYVTIKNFYFGQAGTSGSAYTIVVDFLNNQNALTITNNSSNRPICYGDTKKDLIANVRLVGQDGQDVINFDNLDDELANKVTVSFEWDVSEIKGTSLINKKCDTEKREMFYPVYLDEPFYYWGGEDYQSLFPNINNEGNILNEAPILLNRRYTSAYYDTINKTNEYWARDVVTGENDYYHYIYDGSNHYFQKITSDHNNINAFVYRKLRDGEAQRPKIRFEAIQDSSMTEQSYRENGPFFINDNGVFVLDPKWRNYYNDGTGYNEAQTYYKPVLEEANIDRYPVLAFQEVFREDGQELKNRRKIVINTNHPNYNEFTVDIVMNSISIMKVTISGFGDYDLVTKVPISLRRYQNDYWYASIVGTTAIRYSSNGDLPDYYKNPYQMRIADYNTGEIVSTDTTTSRWRILIPTIDSFNQDVIDSSPESKYIPTFALTKQNISSGVLQPVPIYIPNAPNFGVQYIRDDSLSTVVWTQPILVYQDEYPSSTVNAWNGKDITMDEGSGTILASAIAAGKKGSDNKFSGVMIGDWSRSDSDGAIAKQTGLYGFNNGAMSFAFKEDGTGFIGKDGRGRIYLAGDKSQIYSSNWIANKNGLFMDLDKGIVKMVKSSSYLPKTFLNESDYNNYDKTNLYYETAYIPVTQSEYNNASIIKYYPSAFQPIVITSSDGLRSNANSLFTRTVDIITPETPEEVSAEGDFISITTFTTTNNSIQLILETTRYEKKSTITGYNEGSEESGGKIIPTTELKIYKIYTKTLFTYTLLDSGRTLTPGDTYYIISTYTQLSSADQTKCSFGQGLFYKYISDVNQRYIPVGNLYYNAQLKYVLKDSNIAYDRYATLSADEDTYPLAIGQSATVSSRPFRVMWNGKVFITDGVFTGDVTANNILAKSGTLNNLSLDGTLDASRGTILGGIINGGTINGSTINGSDIYGSYVYGGTIEGSYIRGGTIEGSHIIAEYLEADLGYIAGWVISDTYLQSPDKVTTLYSNAGTNGANIVTNYIKVNTTVGISGYIGYLTGSSEGSATNAIGITSANTIILDSTGSNIAVRATQSAYLEGGYGKNLAQINASASGRVFIKSTNFSVQENEFRLNGYEPEQEYGIYARFA